MTDARFPKQEILNGMESLRRENGAFIASPSHPYRAMWLRDTLYATYAYFFLDDFEKLRAGLWVVFDYLRGEDEPGRRGQKRKIKRRIASPVDIAGGFIHIKCDADTLVEITDDAGANGWKHHQLDWIGLLFRIVAELDLSNIRIIRDQGDIEILQLLVYYLRSVEYWEHPDYSMWENCQLRHAISIGAIVDGLTALKSRRLTQVDIPDPLVHYGQQTLDKILPYESRDSCDRPHHRHCCDAGQLMLLWPHQVMVNPDRAQEVLLRIVDGHTAEDGEFHRLRRRHGFQRHWGDDYYRSTEGEYIGVSAEWPLFYFLLSIIYSDRHEHYYAGYWFGEGCNTIVNGAISEAYQNGRPNPHTPLALAHAIALIAFAKLHPDQRKDFL